ncbi:hypothetical protein PUN28_012156 [Cardiocondyla obscurior]|uniref:Uncharacterized protein n=1 Tax=Cardiocondyla obscurior TaxID=286306 RepID=A0AAW2FE43_9HYME
MPNRQTQYAPGTSLLFANRAPGQGAKWRSGGALSERFTIRVSSFPGPVVCVAASSSGSCVARERKRRRGEKRTRPFGKSVSRRVSQVRIFGVPPSRLTFRGRKNLGSFRGSINRSIARGKTEKEREKESCSSLPREKRRPGEFLKTESARRPYAQLRVPRPVPKPKIRRAAFSRDTDSERTRSKGTRASGYVYRRGILHVSPRAEDESSE